MMQSDTVMSYIPAHLVRFIKSTMRYGRGVGRRLGGVGEGVEGRVYQRLYIRETIHSALNLYCTIRAQLISATRGVPVNPRS